MSLSETTGIHTVRKLAQLIVPALYEMPLCPLPSAVEANPTDPRQVTFASDYLTTLFAPDFSLNDISCVWPRLQDPGNCLLKSHTPEHRDGEVQAQPQPKDESGSLLPISLKGPGCKPLVLKIGHGTQKLSCPPVSMP